MASEPDENIENLPSAETTRTEVLRLGSQLEIDLSHLPEEVRTELLRTQAHGLIDLQRKMAELGIENQALETRLRDISDKVGRAHQDGVSATVTGAYEDNMGRTEVIIGNTEQAAKGKLDRSQKGEADQTIWFVLIGAIVIVIVAAIIAGG